MKKNIFFLFVLLFGKICYSQSENAVSEKLFKINILTPGLNYESKIGNKKTLNLDLNLALDFANINGQIKLKSTPFIRTQLRYYYNVDIRVRKGKSISNNSGSFIGPSISFYTKTLGGDRFVNGYDGLTVGSVWGFQKSYKSNLNLSTNVGLGYNFSNNVNSQIVPILNFTFAWIILK